MTPCPVCGECFGDQDLVAELERLRTRCAQLEALRERVADLICESNGVAGYHLNGAVAAWSEFDQLMFEVGLVEVGSHESNNQI